VNKLKTRLILLVSRRTATIGVAGGTESDEPLGLHRPSPIGSKRRTPRVIVCRPLRLMRPQVTARRVLAVCSLAGLVSSCSAFESHDCMDIGCTDALALSLRIADGTWDEGQYELVIDGDFSPGPTTCRFRVPDDIPAARSATEIDCSGSLSFSLGQDEDCTNPLMKPANQEPCVPLPGQFVVSGGIEAAPKTLTLSLTRDGSSIVSRTVRPTYKQNRPAGPGCGSVCEQAHESITLP